jgi:hypothetical protein
LSDEIGESVEMEEITPPDEPGWLAEIENAGDIQQPDF